MIRRARRDGREARGNEEGRREREDSELIRRARRDGREARGNEEVRRERIEKGGHCFFKSSGYDKLELKQKKLVFSSL